jgi:hypothetical protein
MDADHPAGSRVRRLRLTSIGVVGALAALVLTPTAGAAVTIGQTEGPLTACDAGYDWVAEVTPSGDSYVVPNAGGVTAWTVTSWATNAGGRTGDRLAMKIFRRVGDPATYQVVGHSGPETLAVPDKNSFPANVPVRSGDILGFHTGTTGMRCTIDPIPGANIRYYEGDLADGASAAFDQDVNYLLNIEATLEPTNSFALGTLRRNKKKGTATTTVSVPNPGTLTVTGKGVKQASAPGARRAVDVPGAGDVPVPIRAKGKKRKKLNKTGKVKVQVQLSYTPSGGTARIETLMVKLKKKL